MLLAEFSPVWYIIAACVGFVCVRLAIEIIKGSK